MMDEKDYYIHSGLGIPTGADKPINLIDKNDAEKKDDVKK